MALIGNIKKHDSLLKRCTMGFISGFLVTLTFGTCLAVQPDQRTFASPDEAVKVLIDVLKADDTKTLAVIFGPKSKDVLSSGDPIADKAARERFVDLLEQNNRLEEAGANEVVLIVGSEDWPFPIPIVKIDGAWRFDTNAGREEILARRIGRNELSVIQTCLAYVDAQREYALKDRDADALLEYAQKFSSDPGKKDGLYWEAKEGDEQSPLGPIVAEAQKEGYATSKSTTGPVPYHGYYYRILKGQGKDASDGAYDYVVNGKMIGGFALVAYPARYGSSGVMTFIVSHDGVIYQKDLGIDTEDFAQEMKLFNPDSTWKQLKDDVVMIK